jgi:hypothetical protein
MDVDEIWYCGFCANSKLNYITRRRGVVVTNPELYLEYFEF